MTGVNDVSDFCALGLHPSPSLSVEILLHSESVQPSSSVALLTLGSLSFFPPSLIWIVFPEPPFCCPRLCNASQAEMGCNYHNLYCLSIHFHQSVTWLSPVSALPVITKSPLIKHKPFSEALVSSPLPGPVFGL